MLTYKQPVHISIWPYRSPYISMDTPIHRDHVQKFIITFGASFLLWRSFRFWGEDSWGMSLKLGSGYVGVVKSISYPKVGLAGVALFVGLESSTYGYKCGPWALDLIFLDVMGALI